MFRFLPEEFVALDKSPLSPVYAETFVYTPAKHEENLGQLYMAAEVFSNKSRKENAQLISEIAGVIKKEYYKNTIVTPISALRFGLKRANMFLAAKKNWLSPAAGLKIKIVTAVLKERNLHLAKLGEATALILRNDNLQHIIPPASNATAHDAAASWAFENIVSGELMENDTVVLATNQIHRIDEHELVYKLKKKELAKYLKNSSEGIKSLALVALYPKKDTPVSPPSPPSPLSSFSPVLPPFTPFDGKKGKWWLKPAILVLILLAVAAGVSVVA
ncbi:MAG: hypothetical protein HYV66_00965, partial [Candidatus Sungbacteria bacterium]|nr:hypothetical protein [Candidatus Sungbacteria bacterium]